MIVLHCHAGCQQSAVVGALQARGQWGRGVTDRDVLAEPQDCGGQGT
jgi:hypothetical protein